MKQDGTIPCDKFYLVIKVILLTDWRETPTLPLSKGGPTVFTPANQAVYTQASSGTVDLLGVCCVMVICNCSYTDADIYVNGVLPILLNPSVATCRTDYSNTEIC